MSFKILAMDDATPTEREAVKLRWRAKNPEAGQNAGPSTEEEGILLKEIRERAMAIESESLRMLMEKMRVRPSRAGNTRHAQSLFVILGILVVAMGLYMGATWLFAH
jgi:hypothetical protein